MDRELKDRIRKLKLVVSDCDGVLTDGGLYYLEDGQEMKRFHVLDGMGFLRLQEHGVKTGLITGENNELVKKRAHKLQIDYIILGTKDKLGALQSICEDLRIGIWEAAYIGDDVFDVPAIENCGFGVVPADALPYIRKKADYVTEKGGGKGCFREISDIILREKEISLLEE
jgi:YrbI family 3-deoxy-D-manno-octulosonate 8-phosphate phosphatase